jgi:uncharacterized RmlC-like cupin family protein
VQDSEEDGALDREFELPRVEQFLHDLPASSVIKGQPLEHHLVSRTGDFVYIPANVPHLPYNASETEPCIAVISRTDPNGQEIVVLLPELDAIHT